MTRHLVIASRLSRLRAPASGLDVAPLAGDRSHGRQVSIPGGTTNHTDFHGSGNKLSVSVRIREIRGLRDIASHIHSLTLAVAKPVAHQAAQSEQAALVS